MIAIAKVEESIRQSEYLSAVLHHQTQHHKPALKDGRGSWSGQKFKAAYVFDLKTRNNKSELLPRKNSTTFKKYGLTSKYSETTPKKVKMTPFQDRKTKEKEESDKKMAAACLTEQSQRELQATKSNWLIIKQMERPSSEGKSLKHEIKRIKLGIEAMRNEGSLPHKELLIKESNPVLQRLQDQNIIRIDKVHKNVLGYYRSKRAIKEIVKKNKGTHRHITNMGDYLDYKMETHFIKQANQDTESLEKLKKLCVLSQKCLLVEQQTLKKQTEKKCCHQTSEKKPFKRCQCGSLNKATVKVVEKYMRTENQTADKPSPSKYRSRYYSFHSNHSQSIKINPEVQRMLHNVTGWEGEANAWEKETYF